MSSTSPEGSNVKRRDFLVVSAGAFVGIGVAALAWPFIDQMNPSADVLVLPPVDVDLSGIETGQSIRLNLHDGPVYIRRRTPDEIARARADDNASDLIDPQLDADRVQEGHEEWLIIDGRCTHLGCITVGESGDYDGWFCPCHAAHFDTSGRVRRGPAPRNLRVPKYKFRSDTLVSIFQPGDLDICLVPGAGTSPVASKSGSIRYCPQ